MSNSSNFKELSLPLPANEQASETAKQRMLWSIWAVHCFCLPERMPKRRNAFLRRQPSGCYPLCRTGDVPIHCKSSVLLGSRHSSHTYVL